MMLTEPKFTNPSYTYSANTYCTYVNSTSTEYQPLSFSYNNPISLIGILT